METPEFLLGGYCNTYFTPEKCHSDNKPGDHFIIEDLLLDYPNDDDAIVSEGTLDTVTGISTDSSSITVFDSCNSSVSGSEPHFSGDVGCRRVAESQFSSDLCVPDDDLAELEWLSNLVEESFSSEDLQKLQLISGTKAWTHEASEARDFGPGTSRNAPMFQVPGKARSKRSRAAPCNWTSRLLVLSPTRTKSTSPEPDIVPGSGKKPVKATPKKKEDADNAIAAVGGSDGSKCLHCATNKTPQWRTGPMGPKTLCNACGVRYKSGRLVPEYRPAASPTFMLTEHSNSHRKVLELRKQKELQMGKQHHQQFLHHQSMIFDLSNGDDYLIHQHMGPDFRQLI